MQYNDVASVLLSNVNPLVISVLLTITIFIYTEYVSTPILTMTNQKYDHRIHFIIQIGYK
jgi:hypothetical protein